MLLLLFNPNPVFYPVFLLNFFRFINLVCFLSLCYIVFLLEQVYENVFKCGSWCFLLRACLVTPKTREWTVRALVAYLPNKGCFREANETNNRVVRALLSPLVWIIRAGCSIDDMYIFITYWQCNNRKMFFFQVKVCKFYLHVFVACWNNILNLKLSILE